MRRVARRAVLALGDVGLAQDITQDAFLQAHRLWKDIDDPDAWVVTVLYRRLAKEADRQRRKRMALSKLAGSARALVTDPTVRAEMREDYWRVREAIDRLPGKQRVVIILRLVDEVSEAQAAEILGISPSSVSTHLGRALTKLHRQFGSQGERLFSQIIEEGETTA